MRPDLVSWRPNGAPSPRVACMAKAQLVELPDARRRTHSRLRLLIGFYWVVSSLVQRAENGREQARLAIERQVVCSAFGSTASRELCASTRCHAHPGQRDVAGFLRGAGLERPQAPVDRQPALNDGAVALASGSVPAAIRVGRLRRRKPSRVARVDRPTARNRRGSLPERRMPQGGSM